MTCIRCHRKIDDWARICPFCNWNQNEAPPQREVVPAPVANYKPPEETTIKRKLTFAGAGILLLIAAFGIGVVINKDDAPKVAPQTVEEQAAEHAAAGVPRRADTPLIPTNERGGFEQPITSAPAAVPADGTTTDYQRTDATAVSATEYAEMAKRAKAEKERMAAVVDPRSITGSPYVEPPARRTLPPPQTSAAPERDINTVARTRPVLEYRPLPPVHGRGTARLTLLVGPDGGVRQVALDRPLAGSNAQLVAAVQRWRFRPATQNGRPVAAPYSVEISFQ
ncbi:MAG TPA: energy transducer TonB [Thermoanaerobaculia bacterium]|nr:energy transducer TonB [Thermoanaerobaculia bacterium]